MTMNTQRLNTQHPKGPKIMCNKPQDSSASPDDPNLAANTEGSETGSRSRRQFFAKLSQVGAGLVAGLSLSQTTPAHNETAAESDITPEPPTGTAAISWAQPLGIAGNIPTAMMSPADIYVYSLDGQVYSLDGQMENETNA